MSLKDMLFQKHHWANFAAMDRSGEWWVYDGKPEPDEKSGTWYVPDQTRGANALAVFQPLELWPWNESLVKR